MNRNFILPGLIAAALHVGVFALPRGAAPKPIPEVPALLLKPFENPREIEVVEPERVARSIEESGRPEPLVPRSADVAVLNPGPFQIDVQRIPITANIPHLDAKSFALVTGGTGDGPGLIGSIDLDNEPRTRVRVPPPYPPSAKSQGLSGQVLVEFVVNEAGRVLNPRIVRSSDSVFDEPTLQAVAKWRFEPGRRHGQIVRFRMTVPVMFNLNE